MRKDISVILFLPLLALLSACTGAPGIEEKIQQPVVDYSVHNENHALYHNCDVFIDGDPLPQPYYAYYDSEHACVALPLIAILEEFGAVVQWKSHTEAEITIQDNHYCLNTEEKTFVPTHDKEENLITLPPGISFAWYERVDDDYLINEFTLQALLIELLKPEGDHVRLFYDTRKEKAAIEIRTQFNAPYHPNDPASWVGQEKPLTDADIAKLQEGMPLGEAIVLIGKAGCHTGSGFAMLQYDCENGKKLLVWLGKNQENTEDMWFINSFRAE